MPVNRVVVLSGKGGTGKTSVTAAFAHLAQPVVLADCDVDAPDLHLIAAPTPETARAEPFFSGFGVELDAAACVGCGACLAYCRFDAVRMEGDDEDRRPAFDDVACEGCGVCVDACPVGALRLVERRAGDLFAGQTRFGPMAHARLLPGRSQSGKLVSAVRHRADELAREGALGLELIDGPPGVGCPVIASLSGVDAAVLVAEPTVSAEHDLARVLNLCRHFATPAAVIVNKADLNAEIAGRIERLAHEAGARVLGRLPFDESFVRAVVAGRAITELPDSAAAEPIRGVWRALQGLLDELPA